MMPTPDIASNVRKATTEYIYNNTQCTITYTSKPNTHFK